MDPSEDGSFLNDMLFDCNVHGIEECCVAGETVVEEIHSDLDALSDFQDSDYDISDGEDGDLDVMASEDELRSSDDEEQEHKGYADFLFVGISTNSDFWCRLVMKETKGLVFQVMRHTSHGLDQKSNIWLIYEEEIAAALELELDEPYFMELELELDEPFFMELELGLEL
ncbi:hypothetical protein M569_11499 [Genlisea aurea]|uniref:Uncharacterized protein n=1 Tax=Genlisea aurea TaxID=192259 RepID=S8CFH7_9LAMI|nr:hypothetical protein M569_11499 [Genlisea aurea]